MLIIFFSRQKSDTLGHYMTYDYDIFLNEARISSFFKLGRVLLFNEFSLSLSLFCF